MYVKESENVDEVLIKMSKQKIHVAVILDKLNRTYGIVTFNDIISRLVKV
jgi:CBS domain containing-hemolysin-like protein